MQNNSVHIITGATGGIGREIALALAQKGKCLILACRNEALAQTLAQEIMLSTGNQNISVEQLDLSSRDSIINFSKRVNSYDISIHALINNAGVMCRKFNLTVDGIEETFAVNYFGTVLLTNLLLNKIESGGKIIFTTSITRKLHRLNSDILNITERKFSQLGTYGRSKCAITHYSLHLSQILQPRNIVVNCSDPGIVDSGMITLNRWFDPIANYVFRPLISSASDGARATLKALSATQSGYIYTQTRKTPISTKKMHRTEFFNLIQNTNSIIKLT